VEKNIHLKTIVSRLEGYVLDYFDGSTLFVREHADLSIMAQITCHEERVQVSVQTNYSDPPSVAQLIFDLMHILPITMAEPFYEAFNGQLVYGDKAYETEILETNTTILETCPAANEYPI